jgi:rhodanese-related sulfurtransferase
MKKALLALLIAAALGVTASAAPTLFADAVDYNFGNVVGGTIVVHTFILSNTGTQAIQISKVRASCGCTTTALSNYALAAGESVQLEARVDTSGFSGDVVKSIYVEYTAGASEPTTLALHVAGTVVRAQEYNITVGDLNYLFYILIDLREPDAYAAGHLMGALSIPYAEFSTWVDRLPKGVIIVLYDQDGGLSDQAVQELLTAGFNDARSLLGGLNAWTAAYQDLCLALSESNTQQFESSYMGNLPEQQSYHVSVADLNYLFYVLVDLREPDAYAAGHLMGALSIPYADFTAGVDRLPKGVIIVLYDDDGTIADQLVQELRIAGFDEARSLLGGLNTWTLAYGNQFILKP